MERNIESMAREAAEAARDAFGDEFVSAETAADFCHEVEREEPGTYPDFAYPLPEEDGWKLKDAYLTAWNAMARQAKAEPESAIRTQYAATARGINLGLYDTREDADAAIEAFEAENEAPEL